MNWADDPEIGRAAAERNARNRLLRSTILWMPLFLAAAAGAIFFLVDVTALEREYGGTWVLVVILGFLALLFGFQAFQALFDYLGSTRTEQGLVTRRWSRSDSFVMRTHYLRLDRRILRGDVVLLTEIKEGDYVEATFYPHSAVIVWVERITPLEEDGDPA